MKQGDNTSIDDIEYDDDEVEFAIQSVLGLGKKCDANVSTEEPERTPLAADAVDLMEEFKMKYHDIMIDDNNHETDHSGR